MLTDLKIVVPSKGRPKNWATISRLLPDAFCCVDEREEADYLPHVPAERLILHPPTETFGAVREWIVQNTPERCVVQIDDDFDHLRPMVGLSRKKIVDPAVIRSVIHTGYQICSDLGLSVFCWNPADDPSRFNVANPIHTVAPAVGAFGIIGKGIRFDPSLYHGEDCDFTMKVLLKHRILWCDMRFSFYCGGFMIGEGGLQSMRTEERIKNDIAKLKARWGNYLVLDKARWTFGGTQGKGQSHTLRLNVKRKRQPGD